MYNVTDAKTMFKMVEENGVIDRGYRAVQKTQKDWSAVIEGNKEVIKDGYDGVLSGMAVSVG